LLVNTFFQKFQKFFKVLRFVHKRHFPTVLSSFSPFFGFFSTRKASRDIIPRPAFEKNFFLFDHGSPF